MNEDMQIKIFLHAQNLKKCNNKYMPSFIHIALEKIKFDNISFDTLEWLDLIISPP